MQFCVVYFGSYHLFSLSLIYDGRVHTLVLHFRFLLFGASRRDSQLRRALAVLVYERDGSSLSYSGISAASRDPVEPQQESLERSLDVEDDVEPPQPVAFFQWRS